MSPNQAINVSGTIERIMFKNSEGGYAAMKLRPDEDCKVPYDQCDNEHRVTIVGGISEIGVGQRLSVAGNLNRHPKFGYQVVVESFVLLEPKTMTDIIMYLTKNVRSVGPHYAKKIAAELGMDTFKILDDEPDRLYKIKGIDKVRAEGIKKAWLEKKSLRELLMFATQVGITHSFVAKIHAKYGEEAIPTIKADPYRLARDIHGVGFIKADEVAIHMGVPEISDLRIRAAALHLLETAADTTGDCFMYRDDLVKETVEFLQNDHIGDAMVRQVVADAAVAKIVIDDEGRVYSPDVLRAETEAAVKLSKVINYPMPPALRGEGLETAIRHALSATGLELSPGQVESVSKTMRSKVSGITGGPGVGKTTVTKAVVAGYEKADVPITLLAPTGRAAKRMTEVIGRAAYTIHRTLFSLAKAVSKGTPIEDVLIRGVIFVDEFSMVDIKLFNWFLTYVHPSAILVIVGDVDQLPSVGPGSVLRDLLGSPRIASTMLTQIFRQAAASDIIKHAHSINHGFMPPMAKFSRELVQARGWPNTDCYLIEKDDQTQMAQVVQWCTTTMASRLGFNPTCDVQVLSPMKKGDAGVQNLNLMLQQSLNPNPTDSITRFGGQVWGVGDRLMQIRNNYDIGLFNGDQGRILSFERDADKDPCTMTVDFDGREVEIDRLNFNDLVLSYACTIHKSQGSEYPFIVIALHTAHYSLLQRNLIYTALTRGKKCVVLVAHPNALSQAINNNRVSKRNTLLRERLDSGSN